MARRGVERTSSRYRRAASIALTGSVRLEPGTTKNRKGRTFAMTPELRACLEAQRERTENLQRSTSQVIPFVFHRQGEPIKDYRGAWRNACERAGVPGRIPHDFRRTAVRNLERAGVSRSVAMKMTGHKTESIYRRYAIVSEQDLHEAARKFAAVEPRRVVALGKVLGKVPPFRARSRPLPLPNVRN